MHLIDTPVEVVHKGINSLVKFGLPLQKGFVWDAQHIDFFLEQSKLECDIKSVGLWEDKSIRWVIVQTVITKSGVLTLQLNKTACTDTDKGFSRESRSVVSDNTIYGHQVLSLQMIVELKLAGHSLTIDLNDASRTVTPCKLTNKYEVVGTFTFKEQKLLLSCIIQESKNTGEINIEARLHNPSAAAHVGGKWDLGDANSVIIDDFSLIFVDENAPIHLRVADNSSLSSLATHINNNKRFTLSQFGSGGENWQSPIHWDQNKQSTVEKQGFELLCDDGEIKTGLRAEPIVTIGTKESFVQIALEGFWQNFPVVLSAESSKCKWQLMSNNTELQGGESKTWCFNCRVGINEDFAENTNSLNSALLPEIKFNTDYINQCEVFPHIALSTTPSKLSPFINLGLEGKHSFFKKREHKDVYGWRNYGELDADHEAVNAPLDSLFISHYNNQYDPLMGMTMQFLHSGNDKWLALIHPLNQHIQDIDIYDTTEDKAEYNGGLMWHTDHYLSAETCTHRSNSKYHEHAYDGFLGGGGPGGQHCYTAGLVLQYRLFGDESAKHKVEQLCNWIRHFYNGSGSIAERTFRLLTIDLKQNVLTNIGFKAPGYKYPLDRGTGNYLNALLDCFDVTENASLEYEMAEVVRGTFHPKDDIDSRDLKNIENSWFYTVFLQAVVRYLLLKETRGAIDDDYWYARHAFLHYGKWMFINEAFYLNNAEQLEFPNDTWCAQDTRKMHLFCYLYYFDVEKTEAYLRRADEFYQYIVQHMQNSNEVHFARILALLMQNDGVTQKFGLDDAEMLAPRSTITCIHKEFNDAPTYSRYNIVAAYFKDVTKLLLRFSIKSEWRWLSLRVNSVLNK